MPADKPRVRTTKAKAGPVTVTTTGRFDDAGAPWLRFSNPLLCYYGFVGLMAVTVLFGLVMVLSSSSVDMLVQGASPFASLASQCQFAFIGLLAAFGARMIPAAWYPAASWIALVGALLLQALTLVPGVRAAVGGNAGWVNFGFVQFQPAEIVKLALCMWMPNVIEVDKKRYSRPLQPYARAIIGLGLSFVLIMGGNDLGTGMIVVIIGGAILLVCGMRMRWWAGGLLTGTLLVVIVFISGNSNRLNRFAATYGDCSGANEAQGICYQINHGISALVSGGLTGVGLGASREKWSYLPEAHNDFIFAVIGEELGFVGAAAVIVAFMAMGWCLVMIARHHHSHYARAVILAVAVWICGQAMVNIMVVLRVFPVIGVPMPFVSSGGTALISCMAATGMVMSLARTQRDIAGKG